jgi:hypothetical protein
VEKNSFGGVTAGMSGYRHTAAEKWQRDPLKNSRFRTEDRGGPYISKLVV